MNETEKKFEITEFCNYLFPNNKINDYVPNRFKKAFSKKFKVPDDYRKITSYKSDCSFETEAPSFIDNPGETTVLLVNNKYKATITDENGKLSGYTFLSSNSNIQIKKENNSLILESSSPIPNVYFCKTTIEAKKALEENMFSIYIFSNDELKLGKLRSELFEKKEDEEETKSRPTTAKYSNKYRYRIIPVKCDGEQIDISHEEYDKGRYNIIPGERAGIYQFEYDTKNFCLFLGSDCINNRYKVAFFKSCSSDEKNKINQYLTKYEENDQCIYIYDREKEDFIYKDSEKEKKEEFKKLLRKSKDYTVKMHKQFFFIRCLHDYLLNESEARSYFNFNIKCEDKDTFLIDSENKRIYDKDLFEIVFLGKDIIEVEKNEAVIRKLLNKKGILVESLEITDAFVEQLLGHPLFYYLLNKQNSSKNNFSEPELIKFLINECVILHNDKLLFLPFSEALIARERKICFEVLAAAEKSIDPLAFFTSISSLAYTVSKNKDSICFEETQIIPSKYKIEDTKKENLVNLVKRFLKNDIIAGKYKFNSKITRLFFCAYHLAKHFNTYTFFDDLLGCCPVIQKKDDTTDFLVDVNKEGFDTLIILSGLVLHMIPETDKNSFLMYLANNPAKDYKVQSRKKQIAAIAIITYAALFEWSLFKGDTRKTLFKAAFGQTEYSFQIKAAENLLQNDFYKETIEDCLANLGKNNTSVQPYYFYYYHHFPEQFIFCDNQSKIKIGHFSEIIFFDVFKPFKFRRDTHIAEFEEEEFSEFVKETFSQKIQDTYKAELIVSRLKKPQSSIDREAVFLLYSCQALLISIANYERKKSRIFSNDENGKNAERRLLNLAIYCDYFTRKINPSYCDPSKFKSGDFLLCGPFRISCLRNFATKVEIKDENLKRIMEENYEKWLKQETGRYKILLLRLLAYTDLNINLDELPAVTQEDFLDYDNIDAFKIQQDKRAKEENGEYIFGPLEWYKND